MSLLNELKNEQSRQLQIQAQLAEQTYRAFNGVRQSRENERSGQLRTRINDELPASSLTRSMIQDYQDKEEEDIYETGGVSYNYRPSGVSETLIDLTRLPAETDLPGLGRAATQYDSQAEQNVRDKLIAERNKKLKEINKLDEEITKLNEYKTKATRAVAIVALDARLLIKENTKKSVLAKLKTIDEQISNSSSKIKQIEDNIKLNENRMDDSKQKNKQIVQQYEEGFNTANKGRYQIKQEPTETDAEYISRIKSLEALPFDTTIFKERAANQNILKFQNNLKELVRSETMIGEIVRRFTDPETIFLINTNWKKALPVLLQIVGYNNKFATADDFEKAIIRTMEYIIDPFPRTPTITYSTTPGATPTIPTPGPTTPASSWFPFSLFGSSGTTGTLSTSTLPGTPISAVDIEVKNTPQTIHISNKKNKNELFIKIGEYKKSKKIMYSTTTDSKGEYTAINFSNVKTSSNVHGFKNILDSVGISLNDTIYKQVFGNDIDCKVANIYNHLNKVISDTIKQSEFFNKPGGIIGYGIINDNIPKHVDFGRNILLLNKLYYQNILSIKDKNLHAVEYLPNVKVSDNFVDIVFGLTKNEHPSEDILHNLSTDERHLLDTLLYISGIKSSSVVSNKDDIIQELKNKLRLAEGEIKAGNNNPVVKEELKDILKKLYLYNVISLKNSKDYLKQF